MQAPVALLARTAAVARISHCIPQYARRRFLGTSAPAAALTFDKADAHMYDVLIVGAGVVGATLAARLGRCMKIVLDGTALRHT